MQKLPRNIIDELNSFLPAREKYSVVEARANHIISAAINLMELVRENFSHEDAEELQTKLLLAIKKEDHRKFASKIRQLKEDAQENKNGKNND